jgi:magnesium transporter
MGPDNPDVTRLLHCDDPTEGLRQVPLADLDRLREAGGWFWYDIESPSEAEVQSIARLAGLHNVDLEDVAGPVEYPKVEPRQEYVYAVVHTIDIAAERLRTVEIDVILGDNYLVTVRSADAPGFDAVAEVASSEPVGGPDVLLALLLDTIARRMMPLVGALDDEIDELETLAIAGVPQVLERVQALRRDVVRLRRVIMAQQEVPRTLAELSDRVGPRARTRLESAASDHAAAVDALDTARSLLASVLETYRGAAAERMNEVMKVLTVFSAIVLPLSLVSGIYGMNFAHMPELAWRWGYLAVVALMAAIASGLWWYFARRGFIGGPRVPRVDQIAARGLAGLVHLSMAPVRSVIQLVAGEEDAQGRPAEPSDQ